MDKHELDEWYSKKYKALIDDSKRYPGSVTIKTNIENLKVQYENKLKSIEERDKKEEDYKLESLNTLKQIETNTANIKELVDLIKLNNECQDEILQIVFELLSISKEKDKENAQNKYKKVMDKINKIPTDIETMTKLYGIGKTVFSALRANGIL